MHEGKYESKTAASHGTPCYTERQNYMKNYKKISNMSLYIYVRYELHLSLPVISI